MTGHGGWPLNTFLTPEQAPFYAGTYFPPEPRHGLPSWRMVLLAIADAWQQRQADIREQGGRFIQSLGATARLEPSPEPMREDVLQGALAALQQTYDRTNGGWGGAPKFPQSSTIELLLTRGEREMSLAHAAGDGPWRDLRPGRGRLLTLRRRRNLDRPPLREDALRQRAAGPRLSPRLAGVGRGADARGVHRDARLGAAGDAQPRGRLLRGPRRRLRGRRGQVLRVDARRAPGPGRGTAFRAQRVRAWAVHTARPRAGAIRLAADSLQALRRPCGAGPPRPRRQAADRLERADDLRARRRRRRARTPGLPRGGHGVRLVPALRAARRRGQAAPHDRGSGRSSTTTPT